MNLLDTILSERGGDTVALLGKQFGISGDQAKGAAASLIPALTKGIGQNSAQPGGLEQLMKALQGGNHERYLDNPGLLGGEQSVREGNAILGHILGSKEASRAVADQAAQDSGVGSSLLKKMLPVMATMVMGALGQKTRDPGLGGLMSSVLGGAKTSGSQLGILTTLLDGGSGQGMAGKALGLASKLFSR